MTGTRLSDGSVQAEAGGILRPELSEAEFLRRAGELGTPYVHNGPHRSYRLPPSDIVGRCFRPVVFFSDGTITMVHLWWVDPSRLPTADPWKDWSEARERAVASDNARWLGSVLQGAGSTADAYSFAWGSIWSGFDEKTGGSLVVIRYRPTPE